MPAPPPLLIQAKEVTVKYVVSGLVEASLQPRLACSKDTLCGRTVATCSNGNEPTNSEDLEPDCEVMSEPCDPDAEQCECTVRVKCPNWKSDISGDLAPNEDLHAEAVMQAM